MAEAAAELTAEQIEEWSKLLNELVDVGVRESADDSYVATGWLKRVSREGIVVYAKDGDLGLQEGNNTIPAGWIVWLQWVH